MAKANPIQEFCELNAQFSPFFQWISSRLERVEISSSFSISVPAEIERKSCYNNAIWMLTKCKCKYVEGFILTGNNFIPLQHAWNITEDGQYFDITARKFHFSKTEYHAVLTLTLEEIWEMVDELDRAEITGVTPMILYYQNHVEK